MIDSYEFKYNLTKLIESKVSIDAIIDYVNEVLQSYEEQAETEGYNTGYRVGFDKAHAQGYQEAIRKVTKSLDS